MRTQKPRNDLSAVGGGLMQAGCALMALVLLLPVLGLAALLLVYGIKGCLQ